MKNNKEKIEKTGEFKINKKYVSKIIKEKNDVTVEFKEGKQNKKVEKEVKTNEAVAHDIKVRLARVTWKEDTFALETFKTIALMFIASFLSTIALDIFIRPSGLYGSGLRGITQTIWYAIYRTEEERRENGWIAHLLFFGANFPLAIFGWFKIGKKFTSVSIAYITLMFIWSFITPYIHEKVIPFGHHLGDPINSTSGLEAYISSLLGGLIYGLGIGMVFLAGGSNGGMKFPITYIAQKYRKSIGHFSKLFGIYVVIQGILINQIIIEKMSFIEGFSSPIFFSTIILVIISNAVFDKVFPKGKMIKLQITTSKPKSIIAYFKKIDYNRSFLTFKGYGGFERKKRTMISLVITQFEVKKYAKIARQIDNNCFISIEEINNVAGKFYIKGYQ